MVDSVVIAEVTVHKGIIHANATSGGGIIKVSNGKYIKFVALNEKFLKIQIMESGIGSEIATQRWQKTKAIVKKVAPKIKKKVVKKKAPVQKSMEAEVW